MQPQQHPLGTTTTATTPAAPPPPAATPPTVKPLHTFTETDHKAVGGSGAAKLASSNIAPLVAAARGNITITRDTLGTRDPKRRLPDTSAQARRSKQNKMFYQQITNGDVMVMPWYDTTTISRAGVNDPTMPDPKAIQYRPSVVIDDQKYVILKNSTMPIGVHPATPPEWLTTSAIPILLGEGQLKADSALTAALLGAGITPAELEVRVSELLPDTTPDAAACRDRLRSILNRVSGHIPLVLEMNGITGWQAGLSQLRHVKLEARTVYVGVDGDVDDNIAVYAGTSKLFAALIEDHHAKPQLLRPVSLRGGEVVKIGIDDYLAIDGDFASLMATAAPQLPDAPAGFSGGKVGEVRCNTKMTLVEESVAIKDSNGIISHLDWQPVVPMAGRIVSTVARRGPTVEELSTGHYNPAVDDTCTDITVEVEVGWEAPDGKPATATVTGPIKILSYPPEMWDRHGATVPAVLARHPKWPLPGLDGRTWLEAVKGHRTLDTVEKVSWTSQGWTPVANSAVPAFIAGETVITDPGTEEFVISGVGHDQIDSIDRFGVGKLDPRPFTDPSYQQHLRDRITAMVTHFVDSRPWTSLAHCATVIAAGLRPCLPLKHRGVVMLTGTAGAGKSWTAAAIMSFWASRPAAWTNQSLPGSAADTVNSSEQSISSTLMWVFDDVAPNANVRRAQEAQSRMEDLIRMSYNGTGKGRATKEGGQAARRTPSAMLVVTAENEPETPSIRQRTVNLAVTKGFLNPSREVTNLTESLWLYEAVTAEITQGFIKYLRWMAAEKLKKGWFELMLTVEAVRDELQDGTPSDLKRLGLDISTTRSAEMCADLRLSLSYFHFMLKELGVDEAIQRRFSRTGDLQDALLELSSENNESNKRSTPGHGIVSAIRTMLQAGTCHIGNPVDATMPPGRDDFESQELGWKPRSGELAPTGSQIGWLIKDPSGLPAVLLTKEAAFAAAVRHYPNLLGGAGQGATTTWTAVYDEGLAHPGYNRSTREQGRLLAQSRVTLSSGSRVNGVVVSLATLFEADADDADAGAAAPVAGATPSVSQDF